MHLKHIQVPQIQCESFFFLHAFHQICLFFYFLQDGSLLLPRQDLDLSQVTGIVCRLLANGQVAHSWCVHKSHGFLSSWAVGSFLLVTQTDLKVIPFLMVTHTDLKVTPGCLLTILIRFQSTFIFRKIHKNVIVVNMSC